MTEHNITLSDLDGLDLEDFDSAEYITSDEAAVAYITQVLETNDTGIFASAIGDIARALHDRNRQGGGIGVRESVQGSVPK